VIAEGPPGSVHRPEDVSAEWLTSVLAQAGVLAEGRVAHSVSTDPVGTGQMADTVRVSYRLEPSDGDEHSVVAKFASADEQSRSTGLMTRAYEIEVGFYAAVAGRVRARMPTCYLCEYEADTGWFVILLEDVIDGVQGDQLDGCDAEVAEAALVEMAALHGPAWSDPHLAGLGWLQRGAPRPTGSSPGWSPRCGRGSSSGTGRVSIRPTSRCATTSSACWVPGWRAARLPPL
jgi:hypothetical protein